MITDYSFKIVANDGCKVPVELRKDGSGGRVLAPLS